MPVNKLSLQRLHEIEQVAAKARNMSSQSLLDFGMTFEDDPNLRVAVCSITAGCVEPVPNLIGDEERLAGVLEWSGNLPYIRYEAYDPLVRQRFAVSHELGHFCLHSPHRSYYDPTLAVPQEESEGNGEVLPITEEDEPLIEQEANTFAAAFLLPAEELLADINRFGWCSAFLAERYCVAEVTLRKRLETMKMLELVTA